MSKNVKDDATIDYRQELCDFMLNLALCDHMGDVWGNLCSKAEELGLVTREQAEHYENILEDWDYGDAQTRSADAYTFALQELYGARLRYGRNKLYENPDEQGGG